jgi:choline kinase
MQNFENAIILTAGLGSRLGHNLPKSLVEVNGRKIIDYQLDLIKDIPNVIVVVGFKAEEVISYVSKIRPDVIFVRNFSYENTGPLHSLKLASNFTTGPFLVFDGDTLLNQEAFLTLYTKCKNTHFKSNIIGLTQSKSEQAVFAHINPDNNKIYKFSRLEKADNEFCGPYFIVDKVEIRDNTYIFEFLSTKLPADYVILDVYEVDTPSELTFAIDNFKI